ncbi:MAG: DUF1887 family protein [Chloroflexia bacterium]|nr:DUF1887 family protein [Chloroflexia bacterium]
MDRKRDVIVSLIGREPMPTVLAAMQLRPAVLYGVYSEQTRDVYQATQEMLSQRYGIVCQPDPLPSFTVADAFSISDGRVAARRIIDQYGAERLLFNLTGGTKVTALAFYGLAVQHQIPVLYVDSSNENLLNLSQNDADIPITVKLTVEEILLAHGSQILYTQTDLLGSPRYTALVNEWACKLPQSTSLLTKTYNAGQPAGSKGQVKIDHKREKRWLRQLMDQDLLSELTFAGEHALIVVPDPDTLRYLNGTWLESYTYQICQESGLFDDVQIGVQVRSVHQVENELDVVASRSGRLWLFECKSGGDAGKGALEQFVAISPHQGGHFAQSFFVSAKNVGESLSRRADERQIVALGQEELIVLKDRLVQLAQEPLLKP